ncbi:helix-turn-helix domain-containing protein [Pedobacter hiemivivus]|uniref:Transcriptional regulator n=1 Tax=Pedobacter hiemivivus TaxID=2530454 RepID=A0A4R0N531_9SPHI|nr:transcriptional regulator [Pedobacter hiemivivus]TCC95041.1 transcriptional regulator [Pedobacter hiemivivus]
MELRIFQTDVAKMFSVSEDCITYWENNRSKPQINHYPRIIQFLGYFPFELDTSTIKGQIKAYRYVNGLSQKRFAMLMNADPVTVRLWENGERSLSMLKNLKLKELLETTDFARSQNLNGKDK